MANKKEKWQEIANRGLQDNFDPQTRIKFDEAVRRGLITLKEKGQQPFSPTEINSDFIPTEKALAQEQSRVDAIPERTFGEQLEGGFEAVKTLATGATTGALAFGAGTIKGVIGELTGRLKAGEGLEEAQALAAKFTDMPESEAGQDYVKDIGETLGTLPPVGLTGGVTPKLSLPKSKNKSIASIVDSAPEDIQKSFTKKLGEDRFTPRVFGMVKSARKQGFDDSVTTLVANASQTDKRKMARMVAIVEAGKGSARAKALTRTADVAGDALVKKIDFVKGNNKQAGTQLGRVALKFKSDKVDMVEPVNSFFKSMNEELGVTFDKNRKPIFEGSDIETFPESRKLVNDLSLKINKSKEPTALDAHKFKKVIDKSVKYGKSDGKLDSDLEHIAKTLRGDINDTLSAKYPEYKQANKQFSDTIKSLNELQDVAGRKLDFSGPNSDKAAGVLLRSQTNNTKGRANLLTAIANLEGTAKKYGGSFDDDILNLSIFSDELDAVFGSGARTSLRGEVGKANVDAAIDISQMTIPGAIAVGAKAGAKRIRGINELNQIKAIKALLKAK